MKKNLWIFLICVFMFYAGVARSQEISQSSEYLNETSLLISEHLSKAQEDLSNVNLRYLEIALSIIFASVTLLTGAFYLFSFKPMQDELKKLKRKVEQQSHAFEDEFNKSKKEIEELFEKNEEKIKGFLDSNEKELEDISGRVKNQFLFSYAESSRSLAIISDSVLKVKERAFYWWLRSAYYFNELDERELTETGLEKAADALRSLNINMLHEVKGLKKSYGDEEFKNFMYILRKKYPNKINEIEDLIGERLNSKQKELPV